MAWIETGLSRPWDLRPCVATRAVAWIETCNQVGLGRRRGVATRAVAWIETYDDTYLYDTGYVATRAVAWIETTTGDLLTIVRKSPPVRWRGLKLPHFFLFILRSSRHPCGGVD